MNRITVRGLWSKTGDLQCLKCTAFSWPALVVSNGGFGNVNRLKWNILLRGASFDLPITHCEDPDFQMSGLNKPVLLKAISERHLNKATA